jgi:hypothetical protein
VAESRHNRKGYYRSHMITNMRMPKRLERWIAQHAREAGLKSHEYLAKVLYLPPDYLVELDHEVQYGDTPEQHVQRRDALRQGLVRAIADLGGHGKFQDILARLPLYFVPPAEWSDHGGDVPKPFRTRLAYFASIERLRLLDMGFMAKRKRFGVWELSDEGLQYAEKLKAMHG